MRKKSMKKYTDKNGEEDGLAENVEKHTILRFGLAFIRVAGYNDTRNTKKG